MNVLLAIRIARSLRTELKIVLVSLAVVLLLPIIGILVIAQSGVQAISDALAWLNPTTHIVDVRKPTGELLLQLSATTNWPVKGYVSEEFGVPRWPWQPTHTGIDIANPDHREGDAVTPFMAGKVTTADDSERTGWGKHVIVDHGNNITSLYGHMSAVKVAKEQEVKPGDLIGLMGDTGTSTGPHVHFEIRVYGVPVNPRIFVLGEPVLR